MNSERTFGMLMLPSQGAFYTNKNKYLMINYLTYFEESILTNEMMRESNFIMNALLNRVIVDKDFNINEILNCDYQAISMFLRAYAYGDNIEIPVKCNHCERSIDYNLKISSFKSKDTDIFPDENGELSTTSQKFKHNIKIKPKTYLEELEFNKNEDRKQIDTMLFYITEIDGEREKSKISHIIQSLKIMEFRDVKKAVFDNLPGIDTSVVYNCEFCEKDSIMNFGKDGSDFLKLPASFINNVLEEIFLLNHYGTSITIEDAKKLTVGERRWLINRLSEELQKKHEAEKAAANKAKSRNRK